jgi:hypothetical protein
VIKQTALNAELREWSSSSEYVSAFNQSNSSTGSTVAGDAPGTYSTAWVATILGSMINASVVGEHLAVAGQVPTPGVEAAARSVGAISQVGWQQFSPAFRDVLTTRLADESTITPPSVPVATLRPIYDRYQQYFFNQICTVQASAFSSDEAKALAASGVPNGHPACYDQVQFAAQPAGFQNAVLGLAVGKTAAPIPTGYGYLVVKVVSRDSQGFTADVQRVLSTAVLSAQGSPNSALDDLVGKARVQVNPAYGTWKSSAVVPPASPGAG